MTDVPDATDWNTAPRLPDCRRCARERHSISWTSAPHILDKCAAAYGMASRLCHERQSVTFADRFARPVVHDLLSLPIARISVEWTPSKH